MITLVGALILTAAFLESARAASYDPYAPVFDEDAASENHKGFTLSHLPVYPFEIIRYPVNKTLVAVETHHIDKKVQWIYEWLDGYGINPKLGILSPLRLQAGVDFDFVRMSRLRQKYPNAIFNGWTHYAGDSLFRTGTEMGAERIGDSGLLAKGLIDYSDRHLEHFYGIGPDTSLGEGHVYEREQTDLHGILGYSFDFIHELNLSVGYRNVNISGGKDGGRGQFGQTEVFNNDVVPGMPGESLWITKTEFTRDSRNQKENSTSGGLQRLALSFNEGLNASNARFFKYEVEGSKYFRAGSDRRVFVLHGFGEHNDEIGSNYVPFHQMPMLGGHGTSHHLSRTLRAYDYNRFTDESALLFNLEYRYTIWEYRDWKTDTILFWDEGQVFGEFSEFQMKDFRESYGIGLRTSLANVVVLSVELAHGDEGTNFYVRTSAPF